MGITCPKCHSENPEGAIFCADCGTKLFAPKDIKVTETLETSQEKLTRRVKAHFELSREKIAADIDEDVEKITTSSIEALKYYVEGRRLHLEGKYVHSIELMEKAVAVDPEFAMAYRSMAVAYGNRAYRPKEKQYTEKVLELSERLPKREQYLIQGSYYLYSEKTYPQARADYYETLGNTYKAWKKPDLALPQYEQIIGLNSSWINNGDIYARSFYKLGKLYEQKGWEGKAGEHYEKFLDLWKNADPGFFEVEEA